MTFRFLEELEGSVRYDYPLAKTTWFGVGGNARVLFKPKDVADLQNFFRNKPDDLAYYPLGVCSNVIIRDGGYDGVIIKLGRSFAEVKLLDDNVIEVGCASLDVNVAKFACQNSITELEFLIGIPGGIGGAVAMNAGAYGAEIADIIIKAEAVDEGGNVTQISREEFGFDYRKNNFGKKVIYTKIWLQGKVGNQSEIQEKMDFISSSREESQPIRTKTGGSTFKNPEGVDKKAWQLVDEAGCRGLIEGGAKVSEKHCNFLVNFDEATASDIERLGDKVREKVFQNSGIMLHWEIKRIGER